MYRKCTRFFLQRSSSLFSPWWFLFDGTFSVIMEKPVRWEIYSLLEKTQFNQWLMFVLP